MTLHLATINGVPVPQDRPALINSMASDLVAASCAGVDLTDADDERPMIQWLIDAGWQWRLVRQHLDDARDLARQILGASDMVSL